MCLIGQDYLQPWRHMNGKGMISISVNSYQGWEKVRMKKGHKKKQRPSSLLPPHSIPLGCPSAPAPSGGFRMGNTCIPVADSFWYLAKLIQLCKVKKKKKETERLTIPWEIMYVQNTQFDQISRSSEVVPLNRGAAEGCLCGSGAWVQWYLPKWKPSDH